jgi:hypothetical protein
MQVPVPAALVDTRTGLVNTARGLAEAMGAGSVEDAGVGDPVGCSAPVGRRWALWY